MFGDLVGYFVVDGCDVNEAIEIATRIPGTQFGTVEVRQVMEVDGLPERVQTAAVNRGHDRNSGNFDNAGGN